MRLIQLSSNSELLKESVTNKSYGDYQYDLYDDYQYLDKLLEDKPNYSQSELQIINSLKNNSKMERCVNLSKKLIRESRKHIIWCIFIDTITKISGELTREGYQVAVIYGGISSEEREKIILDFQNGKYDILVTNPHCQ